MQGCKVATASARRSISAVFFLGVLSAATLLQIAPVVTAAPAPCSGFVSGYGTWASDASYRDRALEQTAWDSYARIPAGSEGQPTFIWAPWWPSSATFTQETAFCNAGTTGKLYVNADNRYTAYWNSQALGYCAVNCFDGYASFDLAFKAGVNKLEVVGVNDGGPAMVQFRVDVLTTGPDACKGFVSDANTWADYGDLPGNGAVLATTTAPSWKKIPDGPAGSPKFIWARSDPTDPMQATFTRQVGGCAAGATGALYLSADNSYEAFWNDAPIASCISPPATSCFWDYEQVAVTFQGGTNVLRIIATNAECECAVNPAMVQFRVEVGPPISPCVSFVSDAQTWASVPGLLGNPAVPRSNPSSAWTRIPAGPAGTPIPIWATTTTTDYQSTFTRQVAGCSATEMRGVLYINANDAYEAFWNGVSVSSCRGVLNAIYTADRCSRTIDVAVLPLQPGMNTLRVEGRVEGPCWLYSCLGMVQFRLDIEPTACASGVCASGGLLADAVLDLDQDEYSNVQEIQGNSDPTSDDSDPTTDDNCDDEPNADDDPLEAQGLLLYYPDIDVGLTADPNNLGNTRIAPSVAIGEASHCP